MSASKLTTQNSELHFVVYGFLGPSSGAPVPDEPTKKSRPSANLTVLPFTVGEPPLARNPSTTISVPNAKSVFRKPRLISAFGGPNSTAQFTTVPSEPFTSMKIHPWGFDHSIFVSDPFKVIGCFSSNSDPTA